MFKNLTRLLQRIDRVAGASKLLIFFGSQSSFTYKLLQRKFSAKGFFQKSQEQSFSVLSSCRLWISGKHPRNLKMETDTQETVTQRHYFFKQLLKQPGSNVIFCLQPGQLVSCFHRSNGGMTDSSLFDQVGRCLAAASRVFVYSWQPCSAASIFVFAIYEFNSSSFSIENGFTCRHVTNVRDSL